jgi:hypothetical protein
VAVVVEVVEVVAVVEGEKVPLPQTEADLSTPLARSFLSSFHFCLGRKVAMRRRSHMSYLVCQSTKRNQTRRLRAVVMVRPKTERVGTVIVTSTAVLYLMHSVAVMRIRQGSVEVTVGTMV